MTINVSSSLLITALLAVVTVSTASAGSMDWLNDAQAPRTDAFVAGNFGEACKQRGGAPMTLVPRTVVGNPWAKTMAPISGCWEAKAPLITFADRAPIQVLDCEWRKLFEGDIHGATHQECFFKGKDEGVAIAAYGAVAGNVIKRRTTVTSPRVLPTRRKASTFVDI